MYRSVTKMAELEHDLLPRPPCAPDLAPSYYHLSPNLKDRPQNQAFSPCHQHVVNFSNDPRIQTRIQKLF
jgi:hypothetical protein